MFKRNKKAAVGFVNNRYFRTPEYARDLGGRLCDLPNMDYFEECVAAGRLTEEGLQQYKLYRNEARLIDPETAEIKSENVRYEDPYRLFLDFPKDEILTWQYFARAPGSDVWVAWQDLPQEVEFALWLKHRETDPGLRDPLSCWSSFSNSEFFRDVPEAPVTENHRCYLRLMLGWITENESAIISDRRSRAHPYKVEKSD